MKKLFIQALSTIVRQLPYIFVVLVCAGVLAVSIRGINGSPTAQELNDLKWKDEGPLELSPDRGRFALTFSLIEDKSYQFSTALGRFASPDVGFAKGRFVSLFAPTLSYIVMPGYIIGKMFGISQVGTFAVVSLFALINFILLRQVAMKLGAHPIASTIASLLFLFGTPAYSYAVSLYQHHISTFLILLSLYTLLRFKNVWSLTIVWFLCALSISVDNPNLFLMFPIGLFSLGRFFTVDSLGKKIKIQIHVLGFATLAIMALPIFFFMHFNEQSYGNPFQLAGTVASTKFVDDNEVGLEQRVAQQIASYSAVPSVEKKSAVGFFKTRALPLGLYEHFLSFDRGMIVFTPIMLLGVIGAYYLHKQKSGYTSLLLAIIGMNVLLYSMWGDPYGGWAFGSRYLIPTYAILALFLAVVLTRWSRNLLMLLLVFIVGGYSIGVNTVGALTSNRNPPKPEVLSLEAMTLRRERYTPMRNVEVLDNNHSKSFVFQESGIKKYLTAWQYAALVMAVIGNLLFIHLVFLFLVTKRRHA